ncbi:MAG: preprotein translocase subunit SecA [Sphaerochaetaceae bacterium]|jgi:preprotein translocase subunit SecA|nr:preprotein translocase subunit SecA [Sphaerochaetaceae bacterium]HHU88925.1 preprotein translocase subunit SecA [Spirochaetales bacterium]
MAKGIFRKLFKTKQERDIKHLTPLVNRVNERSEWAKELKDDQFPLITNQFKERYGQGESLDSLLPEAFALAREAAERVLGERHYDVQIMGAIVLHQGNILEMKTGEGKTLTCVPAAYLNALTGKGVHIVTVNDYLARRDAEWMGPIYRFLGLSVGSIVSDMDNEARREAYNCNITYGTNNEFGFDYLRDNMKWSLEEKIQPQHNYCIVDEIDSILIDEARTPLIISGQAADDTLKIKISNTIALQLTPCKIDEETGEYPEEGPGDYQIDEKQKRVMFTNAGLNHMENLLQRNNVIEGSLYDGENFEFVHYMTQAVKAHQLFHLDTDYVVAEGKVQIVDEFTGRILHGRRYSDGLHQAIEAKERIKVERQNKTLATITFQNFFRMYEKISGMTGTADTEAPEFLKIYNLDVVVVPTNVPVVRVDHQDLVYLTEEYKLDAIVREIEKVHQRGQPILVGTVSIEKSELLSTLLRRRGIKHEVLNAKNHTREAKIIENAGAKGSVTIATNMAGRGTDIKLGGSLEGRIWAACGIDATPEEYGEAKKRVYPQWLEDYNAVKELGGLYILGTERHESRRIDNQLRGRAGRQGDPGVSRFFISLEDSLMRLFAKDSVRALLDRIGMGGEPIEHSMVSRAIEKAQMRVEERNFEIRKHLLEYDDVLNEQRNYLYGQRNSILQADDLLERALQACEDMVAEIVVNYDFQGRDKSKNLALLKEELERTFHFVPPFKEEFNTLKETIYDAYRVHVEEKVKLTGKEVFNDFLRLQYLRQIDIRWQEHLEQLEALREAVYLRSYAQQNPLLEYKLEGFDIFDTMIDQIRRYIATLLVRVKIEATPTRRVERGAVQTVESHSGVSQFGTSGEPNLGSTGTQVQVRRTTPKVGRNEPCPCGSGKKYKHCHGM